MYTIGKKNKLGNKTFWYFFITKNFLMIVLTLLIFYLAYEIYAGRLTTYVGTLLRSQISYISTDMVSSWILMLGVSLIIITLARTSVLYKQYSFILHHHALHVRRGIFFIKEQIIPYPQITNVEIVSPYIYSLFGLVKLGIETGQGHNFNTKNDKKTNELPPMDKKTATLLAHELMRRAALQNGYDFKIPIDTVVNNKSKRSRR